MSLFIDGYRMPMSEIKKEFGKNRDLLHDAIADATDGTEPTFLINELGWITLKLESGTGSTLCEIEGENEDIYLWELLDRMDEFL